jgi:hypothetical protein
MNGDLCKTNAYNALRQKSVTAWLGLRNAAAPGKYQEYDEPAVKNMIAGVRDFIAAHPA